MIYRDYNQEIVDIKQHFLQSCESVGQVQEQNFC